jgi:hypothetical protein
MTIGPGTWTFDGLCEVKLTVVPDSGASQSSVTVAVDTESGATVDGFSVRASAFASGSVGLTDAEALFGGVVGAAAEMVTGPATTGNASRVKKAVFEPEGTVTVDGVGSSADESVLDKVTTVSEGAGISRVTRFDGQVSGVKHRLSSLTDSTLGRSTTLRVVVALLAPMEAVSVAVTGGPDTNVVVTWKLAVFWPAMTTTLAGTFARAGRVL